MDSLKPIERVAVRGLLHLSDSISARRAELQDLIAVLPASSEQRHASKALLAALDNHENLQRELALSFSKVNS